MCRPEPHSDAVTHLAALQGVGGRRHGNGYDLALGDADLVSPSGIDARRAGVSGQQREAAHGRPDDFGRASATVSTTCRVSMSSAARSRAHCEL